MATGVQFSKHQSYVPQLLFPRHKAHTLTRLTHSGKWLQVLLCSWSVNIYVSISIKISSSPISMAASQFVCCCLYLTTLSVEMGLGYIPHRLPWRTTYSSYENILAETLLTRDGSALTQHVSLISDDTSWSCYELLNYYKIVLIIFFYACPAIFPVYLKGHTPLTIPPPPQAL